jgi:hypothetical protein
MYLANEFQPAHAPRPWARSLKTVILALATLGAGNLRAQTVAATTQAAIQTSNNPGNEDQQGSAPLDEVHPRGARP